MSKDPGDTKQSGRAEQRDRLQETQYIFLCDKRKGSKDQADKVIF